MADISQFRFPVDIRFGAGARSCLGQFAQAHCIKRPLLVTDPGFSKTKSFRLILEQMESVWSGNYSKYTEVQANPTDADVETAWQAYSQDSCDGLVGAGGGSVLDVSRAVQLRIPCPNTPLQKINFNTSLACILITC